MTSPHRLDLSAGALLVSIDPTKGAAIQSFELVTPAGGRPILSPACSALSEVGQSALFAMAPFANRLRHNRLTIAGRQIEISPNTDDPLCLHGWAWQRRWYVEQHVADSCKLSLRLRAYGYELSLSYQMHLSKAALFLSLSALNESAQPAPVGLGFHPYFPRRPNTRISFSASRIWPDGPGHLPVRSSDIPRAFDYTRGRNLPPDWLNECYSGWLGSARICQPDLGYELGLHATGTDVLTLYADPALNRFALEPQSHVSGEAHVGPNGLTSLLPGQKKRIELNFSVQTT